MTDQYEYFGLKPQTQRGSPGVHVNLFSYLPGSVNTLTVTPNFDESQMLPFDGNVAPREHILIEQAYNSPELLGVVGNTPETIQYYQTAKPLYIDHHYACFGIPLTTPQSQYMTTHANTYENLMQPFVPVSMPST